MSGDPIDEYLAALRAGLRTPPARTAEILAEAEDHLRESAAAALQAGHLSEAAAQRAAIGAFGPVKAVIRAHRPSVGAFAAAAALRGWPLLAAYVLLTAVLGALLLGLNSDRSIVPAQSTPNGRNVAVWELVRPSAADLAATFGVFVLVGVVLIVGLLVVRRCTRRSGLALLRLPHGLLPLTAAIALLVVETAWYQALRSYDRGRFPGVGGTRELFAGSQDAALLLELGCALWFLTGMIGDPVEAEARRRASRPAVTAYAVEAGLAACQLLGGYLLLTALLGGQFGPLLGSVTATRSTSDWPYSGPEVIVFYGCAAAGVLLVAGPLVARRRRQLSVRLPRALSLLVAVLALAALGFVEYLFFAGDVMGSLHTSNGIAALVLCSQWAAVLMGVAWVLRTVASLVQWARAGRRGAGKTAPPESASLASAG